MAKKMPATHVRAGGLSFKTYSHVFQNRLVRSSIPGTINGGAPLGFPRLKEPPAPFFPIWKKWPWGNHRTLKELHHALADVEIDFPSFQKTTARIPEHGEIRTKLRKSATGMRELKALNHFRYAGFIGAPPFRIDAAHDERKQANPDVE